ncbi:helicase-related protein [Vibrio maerlii]|uniref:helicase-related protein n=1 Tax=Vibrio maerlii TaxID=2231648 RepID=UPI000E3BEC76|nr:helicase-related protein [Vibrio maerlii]
MSIHSHALPIEAIKPQFHRAFRNHNLVVEAETGSGKSTCLPVWAKEHGRVLVVEPRRIACTSLAHFLASQSGKPLGQEVGYAIKLDVRCDENTAVVFVTPGVALRWYAENQLSEFDIVMIDEFHERRWDTDLLLSILNKHQSHRLIVTSATLQTQRISEYLDVEILKAKGRVFNVSRVHVAKDSRYLPDYSSLVERVCQEVENRYTSINGDILVFLPGKKEIRQCRDRLNKLHGNLLILELHAGVNESQRKLALNPQELQKVVLATNVAETSLTIPNVQLVIDSGLERRTLQRNGRTVLSLKNISKASATQRAGRAGRTSNGQCIHLYGEYAPLELVTPPELQREDLTEPMLAAACCGERLSSLEFLDAIPAKPLAQATQKLQGLNAIDQQGVVTEHGKVLYPLPIDSLYADLVTRIESKASKEAMIDLCAAICTPAQLYSLPKSEIELEKLNQSAPVRCDVTTLVRLIRGEKIEGLIVDVDALTEAQALSDQIREVFEVPHRDVASRLDPLKIIEEVMKLHPELVFVRREKRKQALGNGFMELSVGHQSRLDDAAEAALVFDYISLPGRGVKQTLSIASVMMPIPLNLIVDHSIGLDSGVAKWENGETAEVDGRRITQQHYIYAGRMISTKQEELTGADILPSLVESIRNEEILPGLYRERDIQIESWKLFCALGLNTEDLAIKQYLDDELTTDAWLSSQLETLGVDSYEDMGLIDNSDIVFEGIPYWMAEEFYSKYPMTVSLPELKVSVEYKPKAKRIILHYQDGSRKNAPKRWELPSWQGWRIQYKKASKVVDVR